jgi:hypothetical protein
MSSAPNHRRGHGRIQGNGPRWENPSPEAGCNSTHVARARKSWKALMRRAERRTGTHLSSYGQQKSHYWLPPLLTEDDLC